MVLDGERIGGLGLDNISKDDWRGSLAVNGFFKVV